MKRNRAGTVFVTLIAGAAALSMAELDGKLAAEQWFTPDHRQTYPLGVGVMFFTAMFVFALAGLLWYRVHAQPIVAAAIIATIGAGAAAIISAMAFASAMSGGTSNTCGNVAGLVIGAMLAALVVNFLPIRDPDQRRGAMIQTIVALVVLIVLVTPWSRLRVMMKSDGSRESHARAVYGETYAIARRTILECPGFTMPIGGLESLTISTRRQMLDRQPNYDQAYYDFDYVGRKQRGRVTVLFDYHPGLEPRRMVELYVYPRYAKQWSNVSCWLSGLPPSSP